MKLSFFGADQCVTGSCHCLEVNGKKILVDCGLQQGRDEVSNAEFPFAAGSVDYVLVTHAHIDHSGRIPMLIKQGFQRPDPHHPPDSGPAWTSCCWTPPTSRSLTPSGKTARPSAPARPMWSRSTPSRTRPGSGST